MTWVVFTGHRIDEPDRSAPRFPPERVPAAAAWITAHLFPFDACFSSAANGGDILFAEACRALGCQLHLVLPFAPARFLQSSVATDAPGDWEERFWRLWSGTPAEHRHVLAAPDGANPYDHCNRTLIEMASSHPPPRRLLAIWNGAASDKPGGTAKMVALAREAGFEVETFDPSGTG